MPELKKAVTREDVEAVITGEEYITRPPGLTICILSLKNGSKQVGVNYGHIDPAQHDWLLGQRAARTAAFAKVWEAEAYLLRERIMSGCSPACLEKDTSCFTSGVNRIQE